MTEAWGEATGGRVSPWRSRAEAGKMRRDERRWGFRGMQAWQRNTLIAAVIAEALYIGHPRHQWGRLQAFFGQTLPRNLAEAGQPRGGERMLPPPVQDMLTLLRGHGVAAYRVSPGIDLDPLISQRLVEGAWPIRPDGAAPWYLAFAAEGLPAGCHSLERQKDVVLARCP